ncbi:MAG: hypothetical protein A2252_04915 [Elusimicrobia bacterium RIFOXYA2_FULL_39_19]|nr:MAG: hypothetical protein A2252_04915 [Elusimicrobia bacterium RIFOXYA2_FULL_39_19]
MRNLRKMEYDWNGNQLRKEMGSGQSVVTKYFNYEYDFENRMTKVIFPDNSYEKYLYAPNGKRVAVQKWRAGATTPEETTYFVYDALQCNNVYEFSTNTNSTSSGQGSVSRYVYNWPGNEMISKITAYPPDGVTSISYYHYDGIGSASAITDSAGTVNNTYRYDPFGNIITSTGKNGRYSFVGAFGVENDGMSCLLHMGARYYDPTIGRFIQRDPLRGFVSDPLSLNRYIYCGNNPMNFIDPKGLFWSDDDDSMAGSSHEYGEEEKVEAKRKVPSNKVKVTIIQLWYADYIFGDNYKDPGIPPPADIPNNPKETISYIYIPFDYALIDQIERRSVINNYYLAFQEILIIQQKRFYYGPSSQKKCE